jgi:hypothetical protein
MAEVTRVNGDVLSGVNQNTAVGELVSFSGSQPEAYAIVVADGTSTAQDIRAEGQTGESIEAILFEVLTKATITYMQIENDTSGQISIMLEGGGSGWTATTMQTAIRALGATVGSNDIDVTGTTVTNIGLKLATS